MRIENNIQPFSNELKFSTEANVQKMTKTDPFGDFFKQAVDVLEQTNAMQKDVEQKQIDFITGRSDDMIGLSMAQSRASSAIQFTSQVTNKILTAYQEIMRIPI